MSVPKRSIDLEFSAEKLRNVLFNVYSINTASPSPWAEQSTNPLQIHYGTFLQTDKLS